MESDRSITVRRGERGKEEGEEEKERKKPCPLASTALSFYLYTSLVRVVTSFLSICLLIPPLLSVNHCTYPPPISLIFSPASSFSYLPPLCVIALEIQIKQFANHKSNQRKNRTLSLPSSLPPSLPPSCYRLPSLPSRHAPRSSSLSSSSPSAGSPMLDRRRVTLLREENERRARVSSWIGKEGGREGGRG